MQKRGFTIVMVLLAVALPASARKDSKNKGILPPYILQARTVAVVIDPDAGVAVDNPQANQTARKDVETAMLRWGRLEPVIAVSSADLIVVARRGSDKVVRETMPDARQNDRAGVLQPTDTGILIGGQHGRRPPLSGEPSLPGSPHPAIEAGNTQDAFTVYQGQTENPLDTPPA